MRNDDAIQRIFQKFTISESIAARSIETPLSDCSLELLDWGTSEININIFRISLRHTFFQRTALNTNTEINDFSQILFDE